MLYKEFKSKKSLPNTERRIDEKITKPSEQLRALLTLITLNESYFQVYFRVFVKLC